MRERYERWEQWAQSPEPARRMSAIFGAIGAGFLLMAIAIGIGVAMTGNANARSALRTFVPMTLVWLLVAGVAYALARRGTDERR